MRDTRDLVTRIAALRQRLERAQGLVPAKGNPEESEADKDEHPLLASLPKTITPPAGPDRIQVLKNKAANAASHNVLLDSSIRQLIPTADGSAQVTCLPKQLTVRARRLLEKGRELLGQLRSVQSDWLSSSPSGSGGPDQSDENDPLAHWYRKTLAMVATTLNFLQTFPDAPSAQLRLCEGLEVTLDVIAQRVAVLNTVAEQRRLESSRIDHLAHLLVSLETGQSLDPKPFLALAEELFTEARSATPLHFQDFFGDKNLCGAALSSGWVPRFVACHSLNVARVVARVVRHEPEMRSRSLEAILAALIHDAGMLRVPAEILAQTVALTDDQKRTIEGHCRAGAELAARLMPAGGWFIEATKGHHERLDGTGYPGGIRDNQIAPLSRLLAVCDVYAALCTTRPHRLARETRTALTDTLLMAEQGALDRFHAEHLLQLSFYPVGSVVELADGAVGVVVACHPGNRELDTHARPVVALFTDSQGQPLPFPHHVDLAQCEGRSIVRSLALIERRDLLGKHHPELVEV